MSITETCSLLTVVVALTAPQLTETVRARFARRIQDRDEGHKTHDELREDLADARAEIARLKGEVQTAEANENDWRDKCRDLEKQNLELLRQNVNLDTDLKAVLKGGLTK